MPTVCISFTDEDLLLGTKLHNRPLFVSGYIREQRLGRILIDDGSAVNIMPKSTMNQLGITIQELSNSRLVIQGFNQGGQRAIGMIRLEISIRDLTANTLFHIIDSRTSYKLLLGRPWIHENGVVTSTLHQCFKFYQQGIRKVNADSKPFTEAESHFADAKFYMKSEDVSEAISSEVLLVKTVKGLEQPVSIMKNNSGMNTLHNQGGVKLAGPEKLKEAKNKAASSYPEKLQTPPVLRYVPLSQRKKGESPFTSC